MDSITQQAGIEVITEKAVKKESGSFGHVSKVRGGIDSINSASWYQGNN